MRSFFVVVVVALVININFARAVTIRNKSTHHAEVSLSMDGQASATVVVGPAEEVIIDDDKASSDNKLSIAIRYPTLSSEYSSCSVHRGAKLITTPLYYAGLIGSSTFGAILGIEQGVQAGAFAGTLFAHHFVSGLNPLVQIFVRPALASSFGFTGVMAGSIVGLVSGTMLFGFLYQEGMSLVPRLLFRSESSADDIDQDWVEILSNTDENLEEKWQLIDIATS